MKDYFNHQRLHPANKTTKQKDEQQFIFRRSIF